MNLLWEQKTVQASNPDGDHGISECWLKHRIGGSYLKRKIFCEVDYKEVGVELGAYSLSLLTIIIGGIRDEVDEFGAVFDLGTCDYIVFFRFLREAAVLSLGMLLCRWSLAVVA